MWLERHLYALRNVSAPVIFLCEEKWGLSHIISRSGTEDRLLLWLELDAEDEGDPISQGNKLADAVERTLNSQLFGYGMHFSYGIAVIKHYLSMLGPFTFAISNAHYGKELAEEILSLYKGESRVILTASSDFRGFVVAKMVVFESTELALTLLEAKLLAGDSLDEQQIIELLRTSRGAYEDYLVALNEKLRLPIPTRPQPDGSEAFLSGEISVEPQALLKALTTRGRWLEALDLAAKHAPDRVSEIIQVAGHEYRERGLYERLWNLTSDLPKNVLETESVLFWRLSIAGRLNRKESMREVVERYLAEQEAPDLRAIYAVGLAPTQEKLAEAKRAYEKANTAITSFAYGRLLGSKNAESALPVFKASIKVAERNGRPYEVARNTGQFALLLLKLGRYYEAAYWFESAIQKFDEAGLGDWQRRLLLVNDWAFTRILIGETAGLEDILLSNEAMLSRADPRWANIYRSTIGDYYIAIENGEQALSYYKKNLEGASRHNTTFATHNVVHALTAIGEFNEALELARRSFFLTRESEDYNKTIASLSLGLALTFHNPEQAIETLKKIEKGFSDATLSARVALYLAHNHAAVGRKDKARAILLSADQDLKDLAVSGLRLSSGSEKIFGETWQLIQRDAPALEFRFLGKHEVVVEGKVLKFRKQWCEILTLLALHDNGLSSEKLLSLLYRDGGTMATLKATLSKMRKTVPITARVYKLDISFKADFVEFETLLQQGKVRAAIGKYWGPLLPYSDIPTITEKRMQLEEMLRQAVLTSGDTEALIGLAKKLGNDLEVWETTLECMKREDPRRPLVDSQIRSIQRLWN